MILSFSLSLKFRLMALLFVITLLKLEYLSILYSFKKYHKGCILWNRTSVYLNLMRLMIVCVKRRNHQSVNSTHSSLSVSAAQVLCWPLPFYWGFIRVIIPLVERGKPLPFLLIGRYLIRYRTPHNNLIQW